LECAVDCHPAPGRRIGVSFSDNPAFMPLDDDMVIGPNEAAHENGTLLATLSR
jgi:hypothetical protein